MDLSARVILILLASLSACLGKLHENVTQLPGLNYDFVIVGGSSPPAFKGGTAGNVVANRLSENPAFSVLLLEAGGSNIGVRDSIVPGLVEGLFNPGLPYTWNYVTTPQVAAENRVIPYLKGRLLGGSSNGMWYTRGSADDFDRYANVTGDPGWGWSAMQPYFRKNEKWTEPADHHDTSHQYDPAVHNTTGINSVSLPGYQWPVFPRIIEATVEMPEEFHFVLDYSAGQPLGVGTSKIPSAMSYLAAPFIDRPNLDILINAQVSRVLAADTSGGDPHFNQFLLVNVSKEIVISAGSIGTPKILLNSGIANRTTLAGIGIQLVVDLPSVGQNLSEQPLVMNSWFNATQLSEGLYQWNHTRRGPLVSSVAGAHIAWLRLDGNSTIFEQHADPAAGNETPHIELQITFYNQLTTFRMVSFLKLILPAEGGNIVSLNTAVVSPASLSLNATNPGPFVSPLIDLGLFVDDYDLFAIRIAVKKAVKFLSANAREGYVIRPLDDLAQALTSDDALDVYLRETVFGGLHLVGSAAMSPKNVTWGAIDPDLLLTNATSIRIIDDSVMPFVPSCHTQAPTYSIAERGSDLIKQKWR
ncbi:hypothetical protein K438DRAFT_1910610 [Mycena galopus ATCC 62051]|nr:hypothetical protein K438DRAFT_1910610 [Mycena galopus ATCC 62051]